MVSNNSIMLINLKKSIPNQLLTQSLEQIFHEILGDDKDQLVKVSVVSDLNQCFEMKTRLNAYSLRLKKAKAYNENNPIRKMHTLNKCSLCCKKETIDEENWCLQKIKEFEDKIQKEEKDKLS